MTTISATLSDGTPLDAHLAELVRRVSWLSGARVVPPIALVNILLQEGTEVWDYWRSIEWEPIKISVGDYTELCNRLVAEFGFRKDVKANKIKDRLTWEAFQMHLFTKKPVRIVKKALRRMELIRKLQDIAVKYDERDIKDYLLILYSEAASVLEVGVRPSHLPIASAPT